MKKKFVISLVSLFLLLSACSKEYSGEYVIWGGEGNAAVVDINKLEDNNIPYKIIDDTVYIPSDAIDKATYCCT